MIFKKIFSNVQKYFLCLLFILAGCNTHDKTANLISIEITPFEAKINIDQTQQFTAQGTYSDKSSHDITSSVIWHSSNHVIATIEPTTGLATGMAYGSSQIVAIWGGVHSNVATLNVTTQSQEPKDPTILKIDITAPNSTIFVGQELQLNAVATYSDGHTSDVTRGVKWRSSDSSIASISELDGHVIGMSNGEIQISALLDSFVSNIVILKVEAILSPSITKIDITSSSTKIFIGQSLQFKAIATYSDNKTRDVTNEVVWISSDDTIVTISKSGVALGISTGDIQVEAFLESVFSNSFTLQIEQPKITKIEISPNSAEIFIGTEQQFNAIAIYSDETREDVTNKVQWKSSHPEISTIGESNGLAKGLQIGMTEISASLGITSIQKILLKVLPHGFRVLSSSCGTVKTGVGYISINLFNDDSETYSCYIIASVLRPGSSCNNPKDFWFLPPGSMGKTINCSPWGNPSRGTPFGITVYCQNKYSEIYHQTVSGTCS